jgi:PhoH-like ATPase
MSSPTPPSKKLYVIDTNVLLHDPRAMFSFAGALVGIPIMVLEELEQFKRESSGRGKNARETVRYLDDLRLKGSLSEGVHLDNGGTLKILFTPESFTSHPVLKVDVIDNLILLTALAYKNDGYEVKFISKDLNARVKADVLGMESEDYLKGYVPEDTFYKGWVSLQVPAVQLKQEFPDGLRDLAKDRLLTKNEYVLVESQHNSYNYRLFRYIAAGNRDFKEIKMPRLAWPIEPKNPQQLMALDALFDPSLEFVSLIGPAGTGKTFLALLAGLHAVLMTDVYQKMLVSRPVIPLGPDIGYLPGDMQEKLHSWMQPIYDNVEVIVHSASIAQHVQELRKDPDENDQNGNNKKNKKDKRNGNGKKQLMTVEDMMNNGKLSLEAITYMRGRSIPYQYILIDEVQNLSPHEVKTLISRVGQGSKIVLCGDPYQIDSPYLDFSSNGLVIATDRFKGESLFSTVFLETSERSELSKLAGELL